MTLSEGSRRKRVPALAPDDRRASLIEVTIPLLEQHGATVTIRQIADAAGVAEGTIFGVFPDKVSLMRASIVAAFAPDRAVQVLGELTGITDLRDRIVAIVEVLNRGTGNRVRLLAAIRAMVSRPDADNTVFHELNTSRERILVAIAAALEPDRQRLRLSPTATARVVMTMVFASQSGGMDDFEPISAAELSSLLLDGLLMPDAGNTENTENTPNGEHNEHTEYSRDRTTETAA